MSFQPNFLTLWSAAPQPGNALNIPQWWGYNAGDDASATVEAAGYFNYNLGSLLQNTNFRVGDIIYCVCADANVQRVITAIGATITTEAL